MKAKLIFALGTVPFVVWGIITVVASGDYRKLVGIAIGFFIYVVLWLVVGLPRLAGGKKDDSDEQGTLHNKD